MGMPYAQFGNIKWTSGWSMTVSAGASPSVFTLKTVPHLKRMDSFGDLILGEAGVGQLRIRDCLVETPILEDDQTWRIPILDRRWKWRYGEIDGVYNIKRQDKTFIRERTPKQLAELCLEAMGEVRWDIKRLPDEPRPEVNWDNENPADALNSLVNSMGCVLTLDYFKNMVVAWPVGVGNNLPNGLTIARSQGFAAEGRPDNIKALSSKIIYQVRFATEAVGMDTDGIIKPLQKLSYQPHLDPDPEDLGNTGYDANFDELKYIAPNGEEKKVHDLAVDWTYRAYRITGIVKTGVRIPHSSVVGLGGVAGFVAIAITPTDGWSPEDLKGSKTNGPKSFTDLKMHSNLAEIYKMPDNSPLNKGHLIEAEKQVEVWGRWFDTEWLKTPDIPEKYKGSAGLDTKLGIVRLGDPLYLLHKTPLGIGDGVPSPAEIFVDVAFYAGRDGHYVRKSRSFAMGRSHGAGNMILKRDDVEVKVIQNYEFRKAGDSYTVRFIDTDTTPSDWRSQLNHYITAERTRFRTFPSYDRTYYHLVPLVPDGKINQVSWSGGSGNEAQTRVSMAVRHNPYVPGYEDKHRAKVMAELLREQPNLKAVLRRERENNA